MKLAPGEKLSEIKLPSIEVLSSVLKKLRARKHFLLFIDLRLAHSVICEFTS